MKTFVVCYGYRDQICLVHAKSKVEAKKIVNLKLKAILKHNCPNLTDKEMKEIIKDDICPVISEKNITQVKTTEYIDF